MTCETWLALVTAVGACLLVGALGAGVTRRSLEDWYPALRKPAWNPPRWLFAPVWSALYLAMAIAAWRVWRSDGASWRLVLFGVQLALNLGWSIVFFGLRRPGWAAVEIALLWAAIAATLVAFAGSSALAAALLAPYLAWVSFAAALNVEVWRLNRG